MSSVSKLRVPTTSKPHYDGDPSEIEQEGSSFKIKPRGLNIVWGNNTRYWSIPEKNVNEPAELKQVCWLEVTASVPLARLVPGIKYNVSFDVRLKPDAFGWNEIPIHIMAKIGKKGKYKWKSYILGIAKIPPSKIQLILDEPLQVTSAQKDSGDNLYVGLYEVWRGRWKGGLLIDEARVGPAST
ncbi:Phloem protein 2-like a9 [Thalictrum thalictroides]|uniref:Phloem protein 2-like a9 n=1 Tax=Thalictrum thalictroides TaxID=46969 RepID=A0A7J6WKQ8_THATH|nr:Phloem protein 2-like a9 [Thalictrum thalictroides]